MIRGARVTGGGRAPVTADKGNDPLRVRSSAGVGAGPIVHRLVLTHLSGRRQKDGYRGHRGLRRHRRRQDSPLGHGPDQGRQEGLRQGPAQRRGASARPVRETGRPRSPSGGGGPARHHRGPGRGGGPGHGHHRGLPARAVDAPHRRPDTGQRQDRREGRGRDRRRRPHHAPHPESHQHLGRGRRGAEHADRFRPGPGQTGQPDRGPDPGPVHPDPAPPWRPSWDLGRGTTPSWRSSPHGPPPPR